MNKRILSLLLAATMAVSGIVTSASRTYADPAAPDEPVSVTIDKTVQYQQIEGFGGFGGSKPGWEAGPYYDSQFLNTIVDDLGVTIVRDEVPSNFEQEPGNWNIDGSLASTSCTSQTSALNVHIDYLKALKEKADAAGQPLKIIASVWSPPYWMKYVHCIFGQDTNWNKLIMSEIPSGEDPNDYKEEYAKWLIQYIKVMKEQAGVDIYALSVANEPAFGEPYQSAVYTPDELARVIKYVGQRFQEEGLPTKIFGPEDVQTTDRILSYMNAIGADPATRQEADIFAVHGYGADGISAPNANIANWTQVSQAAETYGKPLWMTETSGYSPDWSGAMALAKSINIALKYGKVSAWVFWSLADHSPSEFSLISDAGPNPTYYASKQYYRYIRPGAVQVDSRTSDPELLVSSFIHRQEKTLTTVLVNTGASAKTIALNVNGGNAPAQYTMIRSSESEQAGIIGTVNAADTVTIPAQSVVTLVGATPEEDAPQPPAIVTQPVSVSAGTGGTAEFSVEAIGTPDLAFQWQLNGQDLPGETGRKLFVKDVSPQTTGNYTVNIISPYGSATSTPAALTMAGFTGLPIVKTTAAPVIDGSADPVWDNAAAIPLSKNVIGVPSSAAEFSGTVQAMWDEQNLYYLYQITDNTTDNPGDTVEAFLDLDNSKSQSYGSDDYQFSFKRDGSALNEYKHSATAGAVYHTTEKAGGYTVEASIPWASLGMTPSAGTIIGADAASDDDLGDGNRYKIAFNTTNNDIWLNPSYMGVAQLTTGVVTPAAPDTKLTIVSSSVHANAGDEVNVTLGAQTAVDLYGFDVTLHFDTDAFELADAALNGGFGTDGDDAYFDYQPVEGGIRMIGTLLGADAGKSGDLSLLDVKLKAKKAGPVNLSAGASSEWSDRSSHVHPFLLTESALTSLTLQSLSSAALIDEGQTVELVIGASNAQDLYGFDTSLLYDADKFELVDAQVSTEFAGANQDAYFVSSPSSGKVRLVGTLQGDMPGRTAEQLPLVHVRLKAIASGSVNLALADGATWTNGDAALLPFQSSGSVKLTIANADVVQPAGISINDLSAVAKAFGKHQGGSGYNEKLDLNKDGKIDIIDIAYVANHLLGSI
ncbi:hypothetical protein GZH47_30645 [Paenibacillus rhizovicinus]|uniref:Ig-like domain-containing protein n=1 Tax=Paenibacillus rhizovicinus TaxID=2704463 RepID=A0A6C0P814_9BACL|nr:sugar-binding protein [Paenibacillus rhizovicinus]QHW34727.1 hypothetical protein GZH47_30645 [Paenibacillus rhizovicinus]